MATTVTCDRCDAAIRVEANRYEISPPCRYTATSVERALPDKRYDLCERCANQFNHWINPPRAEDGAA
jgi:hypothetical protein